MKTTTRRSLGRFAAVVRMSLPALAVASCAPVVPAANTSQHGATPAPLACTIHEAGRDSLMMGTRRLFIAPHALAANHRGDVFVGSDLVALMEKDSAGAWQLVPTDSVLGAVVPRDAEPRLIRAPLPSRLISDVRAIANEDGSWSVAFGEVMPWVGEQGGFKPSRLNRLWVGTVREGRWAGIDSLPHPPGWELGAMPSSLIRYGDTLALAIWAQVPGEMRRTLVYERRQGRWAYDTLLTRSVTHMNVSHSPRDGLAVLAVEGIPYVPDDVGNSLYLWLRQPGWTRTRRLMASTQQEVYKPSALFHANGLGVVSWETPGPPGIGGLRGMALVGDIPQNRDSLVFLDSAVAGFSDVVPVPLGDAESIWIVEHAGADGGGAEIRFVDQRGNVLYRTGSPYVAGLASTAMPNGEFLVAGGVYDPVPPQHITSVFLRFRAECRQ